MLTSSDFTSNEVIDDMQIGDTTVDIIGFVVKVSNNMSSTKASKYFKMLISNNTGKEIQVIAWNDLMPLLQKIKLKSIVHISSVKANPIKNPAFNTGNVNFELLVKENSNIEEYGIYERISELSTIEDVTITEAYSMINKTIKIEGVIRSEPRRHKNRDYECIVGSITDCNNMLEIKLNFDSSELSLLMGTSVQLQGRMEKLSSGPPVLQIDKAADIKILKDPRIPFFDVMIGYCTS